MSLLKYFLVRLVHRFNIITDVIKEPADEDLMNLHAQ